MVNDLYNLKLVDTGTLYYLRHRLNYEDVVCMMEQKIQNMEDPSFMLPFKKLRFIAQLEHCMCYLIDKGDYSRLEEIYFSALFEQLKKQPLLYFSLPIKNYSIDILEKYMPQIRDIIAECDKKKQNVLSIVDKLSNNVVLTKKELFDLISYFNYSCSYDNDIDEVGIQDKVVRYLMNLETLDFQSISFIIKYFGYKKCREKGLNWVEILFAKDISDNQLGFTDGIIISLSKDKVINTSFKNNTLSSQFATVNEKSLEGLICLMVLYHEIRHVYQIKKTENGEKTDLSFMGAIQLLLANLDPKEYDRNYKTYAIESDANLSAWLAIRNVIKNYYDLSEQERLGIYTELYAYQYAIKSHFITKFDKDNNVYFNWNFIVKNLDSMFKENPDYLKKYPQFSIFYSDDGAFRDVNELITIDSNTVCDYPDMYFNVVAARLVEDGKLDMNYINGLSLDCKKNVIRNFKNMIGLVWAKIKLLEGPKNDIIYVTGGNVLTSKEIMTIKTTTVGYFFLIQKYSKIVFDIIVQNPELLGYSACNDINKYIRFINQSEVLQSYIERYYTVFKDRPKDNQIDYIPETKDDLNFKRRK